MTDADGNMSPAEIVALTVAGAVGFWIIVERIDNIRVPSGVASQWCSNRSGEIVDGPAQARLLGPYCEFPNGTVVSVLPRVVETSPPSIILLLETAIIVAFVLLVATIVYGYAGVRADD